MKVILTTARLRIRELTLNDVHFIIAILNSEGWLQYIGNRNIQGEDDAKAYIQNGPLKSYAANGYGLWVVENAADNTPMGLCGLLKRAELVHPDIGFAFLPSFTGKGYAFEAAKAILYFAKQTLGIGEVNAITLPYNKSSINLLLKLGMHKEREITMPPENKTLILYSNEV